MCKMWFGISTLIFKFSRKFYVSHDDSLKKAPFRVQRDRLQPFNLLVGYLVILRFPAVLINYVGFFHLRFLVNAQQTQFLLGMNV